MGWWKQFFEHTDWRQIARIAFLGALASAIVTCMTPVPVRAAAPTLEQANSIYILAYGQCPKLTGMKAGCPPEWLDERPAMRFANPEYLCGYVKISPKCGIRGLYVRGLVIASEELDYDIPYQMSALFHEFLHHFQWLRDGKPTGDYTCDVWMQDERDAYTIQAHLLEKLDDEQGAANVRRVLASLTCPFRN